MQAARRMLQIERPPSSQKTAPRYRTAGARKTINCHGNASPPADAAESLAPLSPLVQSRKSRDGRALAYVCRNFACLAPSSTPAELSAALDG